MSLSQSVLTIEDLRRITETARWRAQAPIFLGESSLPRITVEAFATYWVEGGHQIRSQLRDDKLLIQLLRHVLPPYDGQPLDLYRGENKTRWERGSVGFAWTTDMDTAVMYARGLNAVSGGGVLLRAKCDSASIISGPNNHSKYLGEHQYTLDPSTLTSIEVVELYPEIQ